MNISLMNDNHRQTTKIKIVRFGIPFLGIILVIIIGFLDLLSGYQFSFSIFYLIPIILVTWWSGKWFGLVISLFSTIAWIEADLLADHIYTHPVIPYWNAVVRLCVFVLVTYLLTKLKIALEHERKIARIDELTQVNNSRAFLDFLETEKNRAQRFKHLFTLCYIDLDNFKTVNDTLGHKIGDDLLKQVSLIMKNEIRRTDIVGRLGGDEFAILFPETDMSPAKEVINRMIETIHKEMKWNNWPVTLSIGCITFSEIPDSADEIIRLADDLMYSVKRSGKNNQFFKEYKV